MSSRGPNHDMKGEHVLKVEAELRTNGRTNGCARTDAHERTDVRTNEWIMDEKVFVWMNEWLNEWLMKKWKVCERCYVRPRGLVPSTQWMKPYV